MNCRVLYNFLIKRYAGHSKWANIKHIKAVKDAQRGALFTRLSRQMKVAAQEGGSTNPNTNLRLSQVIDQARRVSMPAASIQNILKSMQQNKDKAKPVMFELRAPGGVVILCEVFTDNLPKTKHTLYTTIKKFNVSLSECGGHHLFERKGLIETASIDKITQDTATDHAIESGAEDVKILDDSIHFICDPHTLTDVQKNLEQQGYKILNTDVLYIPKQCIQLPESSVENLSTLCDKLEALEEVVKLHDNIA